VPAAPSPNLNAGPNREPGVAGQAGKQDASWLTAGPPEQNNTEAQPKLQSGQSSSASRVKQPGPQFTRNSPPRSVKQQPVNPPASTGSSEQKTKPVSNPHPTRSIWHYTDKHPAVKRKNNV
ncbi:MAG TPA: hypothetical protein VFN35_34300, partial [Ktedonobacteraceae bacterium]|nr:hypothetical protein [Ktedonobacteraceae bacterium]